MVRQVVDNNNSLTWLACAAVTVPAGLEMSNITVDDHRMVIVGVDAVPVEPVEVRHPQPSGSSSCSCSFTCWVAWLHVDAVF